MRSVFANVFVNHLNSCSTVGITESEGGVWRDFVLGNDDCLRQDSRIGHGMPGIAQKIDACGGSNGDVYRTSLVGNGDLPCQSFNGSSMSNNDFWSKQRDDTSYNQLHKFWSELTIQARQKLMRIDKQTLFEHARKNMYCSRCNGLLLEGFVQIVLYGKSLQKDATGGHCSGRITNNGDCSDMSNDNECQDDVMDPSLYPWGGLTTSRDGTLTLLDPYLHSKSLKGLQNVFDSARARERERKLLYPDACGGGNRGWISQGMTGYGRGHGTRETCALHTARLSVETLVDFWSALGEETRQSLLRMKEEDFIERLMYRFDSKRFCRDCRRNVIREFKELKELKRMRKDPRCTTWFCVADPVFKCEVSRDTVQADWHQMCLDPCGTYHHFEWAIGTGEGKSDILDFKNVGLSVRVQVNGLDLSGLCVCYITLRAWKTDGQCNELSVKAHALRGQQCVHCRLAVDDGSVMITLGTNIRRFFEHAEEAQEEEDDDSTDKDGNELDGECPRPQKHAKSPELAREFLLDAASVIFKEQVEKAFREGTARQNARSIFVCLALKLLEERVHVACKEIFTLEKQMKLLEEEEREKREEEERKERRRIKEREKKMRRKERLRDKETKENKCAESNIDAAVLDTLSEAEPCVDKGVNIGKNRDCVGVTGEATPAGSLLSPDIQDDQFLIEFGYENMENHPEDDVNGEPGIISNLSTSLSYSHYYSRRKQRLHKDTEQDPTSKWSDRRKGDALSVSEPTISKHESRFHADGFESTRGINCFNKQLRSNAAKFNTRNGPKLSEKSQSTNNRVGGRCNSHVCSCNHHNDLRSTREPKVSRHEINWRVKASTTASNSRVTKKVWEPLDSQKKCVQSNLVSDAASKPKVETSIECTDISVDTNNEDNRGNETCRDTVSGFHSREKSETYIKVEEAEDGELCFITRSPRRTVDSLLRSSSISDNSSSCLSEGDSNISSNRQNLESTSTSDSEESSQTSEGNEFAECHKVVDDPSTTRLKYANSQEPASGATNPFSNLPTETDINCESGNENAGVHAQSQSVLPPMMHNQNIHYPVYQAPAMAYYSPVSWPADPTNGLMSLHYSNHYLFANSFGFDLNTNPQMMQYLPPLINPVHMPVFPTVPQANAVPTTDQGDPGVVKAHHSVPDGGQNGMSDKTDKGNTDFSLFHFGGPVALSAGLKAEAGAVGDSCDGNKKDSIEEYNLFASSNGIKFSIF